MVGEGELSAGPQFHPGSLTLFKVRAGPGSEGEEMEVWDAQAQRRAHRRSDPRVRLRRLRGHYGGLPRHCLTPLEYQTPGLILLDREETEAQLRDELAQVTPGEAAGVQEQGRMGLLHRSPSALLRPPLWPCSLYPVQSQVQLGCCRA